MLEILRLRLRMTVWWKAQKICYVLYDIIYYIISGGEIDEDLECIKSTKEIW